MREQDFLYNTPIYPIECNVGGNSFFIKRDDMIPVSFGGNKARKALLFFKHIDEQSYNCVVTYGSASSNHCRVVANMAAARKMPCYIISPNEVDKETYNKKLMSLFKANIIKCTLSDVKETINKVMDDLRNQGYNPYFIMGGGHGNIGTQAYVECYEEICTYEKKQGVKFDYIFFASGTGTTQAGLICGKLMENDKKTIIGISVARKKEYGSQVIHDSVLEYLNSRQIPCKEDELRENLHFLDEYTQGYGVVSDDILKMIKKVLVECGIPMDVTYTGKAFTGMIDYIEKNAIENKNILFVHTGGTPLFFDDLKYLDEC